MLIVHPSSQCDVCLDAYTWSTPAKSPHAIQCGHVFCYDCLRTVNPSNCPMCRKIFNPERIKKLHVDKVSGDFAALVAENELLRRVGVLFGEDADPEDVDAMKEEAVEWLNEHPGPAHNPLRNAIFALHEIKSLRIEKAVDKETIERLRVTHERHADVKDRDLDISMKVEQQLLHHQEQMRAEYEARLDRSQAEVDGLREENARIRGELNRYTTSSNPLPRPPEHIPHAPHSIQRSTAPLGLGLPYAAAPSTQSRTSSNGSGGSTGSRNRAPSVHFAEPVPSNEREQKSRYKVTADGEELRQEKTRRPHLIVPGAPPSQRVIPPRLDGADLDVTPRPPITVVPTSQRPNLATVRYPPGSAYAPRPGDSVVWVSGCGPPVELTDAEKEELVQRSRGPLTEFTNNNPMSPTIVSSIVPSSSSVVPPPVIPPPPVFPPTMTARPAAETGSARMRVAPADVPVSGRSPLAWRPGPAHKEGYVKAYLPHLGGIGWIPEEEASKLPVRAWGTESRYPYVLAKEPSEVDDEWRRDHNGASPGPNPLQLIGVPEAPVAGPSRSTVQRAQYDALPGPSAAGSTLFRNPPGPSDRAIPVSANSSASINGLSILATSNNSRPERSSSGRRRAASGAGPLGLNLTSLPVSAPAQASGEQDAQPSPASTWGTVQSRNSSLGSLQLNNFGDPNPFTRAQSLEQLPIGELNGGPIVLTDAITPRQGSSILEDGRSISGRSIHSHSRDHAAGASAPGLMLNPSAGSSRVVSSVQDLEEVNRSLRQLADPQTMELSRHSRHSRQASMSGDEADVMVGSRTGIALYSSRPSQHPSNGPSPDDPSPPAQSRPRSGASTRSHAESTYSHHSGHSRHSSLSHHSAHSSQSAHTSSSHRSSSDQRRARRASNASMLNNVVPEPVTWTTGPSDMQPYGSSRGPYAPEVRPPPSRESIPRSLQSNGDGLGLTFEAPSTSSAVTGSGEQAAGIHAPRPLSGRRASQLIGGAWNARAGH